MYPVLKSALIQSSIVFACISSNAVYSQSINNSIDDEIIVTAKGNQTLDDSLFTTHVFDQAKIELAQVQDIPELLQKIAGISLTDSGGRGSATSVFVRGTSSTQTIVLLDGVRVGSATLGSAALNSFPIEAIDRIEIIKGPFSGIYGADAAGGVIQLFTKKKHEGTATFSTTYGSDAREEYNLSFGQSDEKNSFYISAQVEDNNGIDRTSITTGGNDDLDAFEEQSISIAAKTTLSDYVTANFNFLLSENTVEFDNTFGGDTGFQTENEALSAAINLTAQLTDSIKWTTTLGFNSDESVTDAFFSDITTDREAVGTELEFTLSENVYLTTGLDYYEESVDTLTDFPETERDNTAAYIQLVTQNSLVNFSGSLRVDDNSAYGTETNGSVAVGFELPANMRIVASYGTAFIAPSFNELFFPFFGNPDIQPEESQSYELSLLGDIGNHSNWRLSAYRTDVDNLIAFDLGTFLAGNINEATLEGIEFEFNTNIIGWDIALNLGLLSATDDETGIELDDRAEQSISLSVSHDFGKLNLGFDLRGEANRFDQAGTEIDSYGLFDIKANYEFIEGLSLSAGIDNVFDKDYTVNLINDAESFNTEGRQWKATLRYSF